MLREGWMYVENERTPRRRRLVIAQLLLMAPVVTLPLSPVGTLFYGVAAAIGDLFFLLAAQLSDRERSAAFAVAVTGVLGALFFFFRVKFRFLYGMTEAVVGLTVAGHRVGFDSASPDGGGAALFLAVLTAGVYLVVRGLDNAHQAFACKSDPALNWVLARKWR
jgi:hypothetical protein